MKTVEEVEREIRACYGRYIEYTNSYIQLCEEPEYTQCDCCCYYFDPDEIEVINGEKFCPDCKVKYAVEEEEEIFI